jgi:hypothetical protein
MATRKGAGIIRRFLLGSSMRIRFALIGFVACLAGCVGVREHWADGFGWMWNRSWSQVAKHGPEFAVGTAVGAASEAVDDKVLNRNESPVERQERKNDEFFEN